MYDMSLLWRIPVEVLSLAAFHEVSSSGASMTKSIETVCGLLHRVIGAMGGYLFQAKISNAVERGRKDQGAGLGANHGGLIKLQFVGSYTIQQLSDLPLFRTTSHLSAS